jgi:CheY-like chemotaxis protein
MLRFLVVDDEECLTSALRRWFEKTFPGAEVRAAPSTPEALRILDSYDPTMITTDYFHPGGNGVELLQHLRLDPRTRHIPVVLLSATDRFELDHFRAGFNAVLFKPFQLTDLLEVVTRLLNVSADPDLAVLRIGEESPSLDYKDSVDLESEPGRAALAKDVIAMANYGGGTIAVGVAEVRPGEFAATGIPDALSTALEAGRVNRVLRYYLDPAVPVAVKHVRDGSRSFVILRVPRADGVPILARTPNDQAGLHLGRLYTRNTANESAEVDTSAELRALIGRFRG